MKVQEVVLLVGCTVMMLMLVFETVSRYIFHYDFAGYEDIVLLTCMWVYMTGAAYQTNREKLIKADLTSLFVKKESTMKVIRLVAGFISLVASIFLFYCSSIYVSWAFKQRATTPTIGIPLKFVQLSMFVGYLFVLFYNVFILIERFADVFDKSNEEGGQEV